MPLHPTGRSYLRGACFLFSKRTLFMNVPCVLPGSYMKAAPSDPRYCSTACNLHRVWGPRSDGQQRCTADVRTR